MILQAREAPSRRADWRGRRHPCYPRSIIRRAEKVSTRGTRAKAETGGTRPKDEQRWARGCLSYQVPGTTCEQRMRTGSDQE